MDVCGEMPGARYCTKAKHLRLARWLEKIFAMVTKLFISRFMSFKFSIDTANGDVKNRWRPFSFTPGRFSSRNERKLGGREFKVMFVNEVAPSPDIERFSSKGDWRIVPMTARKFSGDEICPWSWCSTKVVSIFWLELSSRKHSVGSYASL